MASAIGDGGTLTISGTYNSASPLIVADYRQGTNLTPPDGQPVNCYTLINTDTSSSSIIWVTFSGSNKYAPVYVGSEFMFQKGADCDEIQLITAYGTTLTGATTGTFSMAGRMVSRRK